MGALNIGQAAKLAGVSAKMIRHYETIGLLPPVKRSASGYRLYSDSEVHSLRFIRQARSLGFSLSNIGQLLDLWINKKRPSKSVKDLAMGHMHELDEKIRELRSIKKILSKLIDHCHGDDRPDCPILDKLQHEDIK